MDIIQDNAGSQQLRVGLVKSQPLKAYDVELSFYRLHRCGHVKLPVGESVYNNLFIGVQDRGNLSILYVECLLYEYLTRGQAEKLLAQEILLIGIGAFCGTELACGKVYVGNGYPGAYLANGEQVVIAVLVQVIINYSCAGAYYFGDNPLHNLVPLLDLPFLLADCNLFASLKKPANIYGCRMVWNAAHRLSCPFGEDQVQEGAGLPGVGIEHLIEIPHPEEQEGVGIRALYPFVLSDSRGVGTVFCHNLSFLITISVISTLWVHQIIFLSLESKIME